MKKFSCYNTMLQLTPQYNILYNAVSNQFVIFKAELEKEIQQTDPAVLQENYPHFYSDLQQGGCLVEEEVDEVKNLQKMIREADLNSEQFLLTVNPTLNCNFKCWYCYEKHIPGSQMKEDILEKVKLFIYNKLNAPSLKYFNLSFFGGEPLLYFDKVIHPLIEYGSTLAKEKQINFDCGMTTNGYLISSRMIPLFQKYNLRFFQITLDGNREAHNKVRFLASHKGSYDTILKNIEMLLSAELTVNLRINYTTANLRQVQDIYQDILHFTDPMKKYLNIDFQRVWQDEQGEPQNIDTLLEETMLLFRGKGFSVTKRRISTIKSSCYADKWNQALINYNGDIFKCTARDFVPEKRSGYLNEKGEIIWENQAFEKRMNIKLQNTHCLQCRIAPLCNGGCTQQALEHEGKPYCLLGFDEKKKDELVLNRFVESYIKD